MVMDPQVAWIVMRDGQPVHVRMTKGMTDACVGIEKTLYPDADVKIVPVLMTEIEDVK